MRIRLAIPALVIVFAWAGLAPNGSGSGAQMPDEVGEFEPQEYEREWQPANRGPFPDPAPMRAAAPTPKTSITTGFDGVAASNYSPSDTTGAGGANHLLAAVNINYQLFSRTGVSEVGPAPFETLFADQTGFQFDPRVVYDHFDDHYVLVFVGELPDDEVGYLYVVSIPDATATNQSTWCARRFAADQSNDGNNSWLDYPGLGFDANRIYVTGNLVNFPFPQVGAQIIAFEKGGLYDCSDPVHKRVWGPDATRFPDGSRSHTIQPSVVGGGAAGTGYLMAFDTGINGGAVVGNKLVLYRIRKRSGRLTMKKTEVKVGAAYVHPFSALQQGAPSSSSDAYWDAGDLELTNVFHDPARGRVYTVHTVERDLGGDGWIDMAMRWYEIKPAAKLDESKVTRKGIFGTPNKDAGYPSIATDSSGNVFVAYSRASGVTGEEEYISSWVTVIEPGDTVPDAGNSVLLAAGDTFLNVRAGAERWGDYMAINRDPAGGSGVWVVGQAAHEAGPSTGDFLQHVDLVAFP